MSATGKNNKVKQIWGDPHERAASSSGWRSRSRALYFFHARSLQSNTFVIGSNGSPSPRMRLPQCYPSGYKHDITCLPQVALFQIEETTASPREYMNSALLNPCRSFSLEVKMTPQDCTKMSLLQHILTIKIESNLSTNTSP